MIEIKNNAFYDLQDLREVAERETLLKWIHAGDLKATKIGRKWMISGKNLKDYLNRDEPDLLNLKL